MSTICSSNLTSGFIDLATYDEQEKYLYGGPDAVAYFVREIRKSTWFTQVPVCLSSRSGQAGFGQQWSVSISRAGDYLLHTWLRLTVNAVTAAVANAAPNAAGAKILRWTNNLMHNLISECAITFNDLVAARFDNYHLDFWAAFTVPAGKRNGYNNMIGNIDALVNPAAIAFPYNNVGGTQPPNVNAAGQQVLPAATLNLPLPFFYSRDSGIALPTAALPYNEMRINFAFRNLTDLMTVDTFSGGANGVWSSAPVATSNLLNPDPNQVMSNVNVWANYAIVSNDERKKMACAPRDILIEQVQTAPVQNFNPNTAGSVDIRFSHSIKALFWACRNKTVTSLWSNYTTNQHAPLGPSDGVSTSNVMFGVVDYHAGSDPIANTSLIYENTQRIYQMGSDYFALVNPWYHAPVIPLDTGYHLYSYSLDFFAIDPMGSTNYGKLTNVSIIPAASADAVNSAVPAGQGVGAYGAKYDFITTALNNNIIRISGGALGKNGKPKTGSCLTSCHLTCQEKQCNNDVACSA